MQIVVDKVDNKILKRSRGQYGQANREAMASKEKLSELIPQRRLRKQVYGGSLTCAVTFLRRGFAIRSAACECVSMVSRCTETHSELRRPDSLPLPRRNSHASAER